MIFAIYLYYDKEQYKDGNGIGFYPTVSCIKSNYKINKIEICFEIIQLFNGTLYIYCWKQMNGPAIYGFIKKEGDKLLQILNDVANVNIQYIYNIARRQVFPISNNTTYYILENYHKS